METAYSFYPCQCFLEALQTQIMSFCNVFGFLVLYFASLSLFPLPLDMTQEMMVIIPSFQSNQATLCVSLAHVLQKKSALLRDLDKSLQENQRQNEQHCEKEIEDIRRGRTGNSTTNATLTQFSEEALALAMQAYDLLKFADGFKPRGLFKLP